MALTPHPGVPVTIGHEGAGHITALHPSAEGKGFKIGDAVGGLYILGCCFECQGCQVHNLSCETGKQLLQGFTTDGFFAEYALVDWRNAVVLPAGLDAKKASPIFCAGVTCMFVLLYASLTFSPLPFSGHGLEETLLMGNSISFC